MSSVKVPKVKSDTIEMCITKDCGRSRKARGLCSSCYQSAKSLVKSNQVSWDVLLEKGYVLEGSRRSVSAFALVLKGAKVIK